jgi:ribosomal protein S18 acetylase RimI-like enzyme
MHKFRQARETDFEGICKLITSKEELYLIYPAGKYPFTVNQIKELSQVRKELTVIELENNIIGFANFYNYQQGQSAFIGNVVIDRKYRGRGLGKELISHMLKVACEKYDLPEIRISVFNDNTTALLLYRCFGFAPYELEAKIGPNDNRVVLIHMKMNLRVNK